MWPKRGGARRFIRLYRGTSFGWGKGGNVTSAGWQVTLCDPMWHASSRSGVATLRTAIHLLLTYLMYTIYTNTSEHIRFYLLVFSPLFAVDSVRYKQTYVCF